MSKHAGISRRFALYLSTGNLSSGEELLVRRLGLVRRMLILVDVRLEQGAEQLSISLACATRVK